MTLINKLFGRSKKKELKARCPITHESIDKGFGYLLSTAQIVSSKKYWDMIMTEPETLSYTMSHFKNDENGTRMRSLIFDKYSSIEKPWMISDSCINLFETINKSEARTNAKQWWESEGQFTPDDAGAAQDSLDPETYRNWKDYAVLEAGRERISA